MPLGPLGPRGGIPAFQSPRHAEQHIFQQQQQGRMSGLDMEGLFSGVGIGFPPSQRPGIITRSSYSGLPVFAPNPPISITARSGGGGSRTRAHPTCREQKIPKAQTMIAVDSGLVVGSRCMVRILVRIRCFFRHS